MASQVLKIVSGPSKDTLMLALFYGNDKGERSVEFSVTTEEGEEKAILRVTINKMEREDGSGESWNIGGYVTHKRTAKSGIQPILGNNYFKVWFSTRNRQGTFKYTI